MVKKKKLKKIDVHQRLQISLGTKRANHICRPPRACTSRRKVKARLQGE